MSIADPHRRQHKSDFSTVDVRLSEEQRIIKRNVRLTPEGWVFLVILTFVAFGAILRNVNLLIVLAGIMFSAIILNWRSANLTAKTLTGFRELPARPHSGKLFSIVWKIHNHSPQRVWSISVEDRLNTDSPKASEDTAKPLNAFQRFHRSVSDSVNRHRRVSPNQVRLNIPQVKSENSESSVFHCLLNQRGKYHVGPATISTTFPFGLIEIQLQVDNQQTFYAAPAIGELVPHWEKQAAAIDTGADSKKRKRGSQEDEFFALRKWRSGDSQRNIHWRTTAKMQHPIVRQFDEPTDRDLAIVVDLFQQPAVTGDADSRSTAERQFWLGETILSFASTIAAQRHSDLGGQISIAICGQQNDIFRRISRRKYNANLNRCLAMAKCSADPDLRSGISIVGANVSSGTPIFIISTRKQPLWIEQLDAVPKKPYHKNTNEPLESLACPKTGQGRLTEQIRWLEADTADFRKLFSVASATDQLQIDRFEQKWG